MQGFGVVILTTEVCCVGQNAYHVFGVKRLLGVLPHGD